MESRQYSTWIKCVCGKDGIHRLLLATIVHNAVYIQSHDGIICSEICSESYLCLVVKILDQAVVMVMFTLIEGYKLAKIVPISIVLISNMITNANNKQIKF